jgi:hypothetical protein
MFVAYLNTNSKISLHFCKDCRILCEGVEDDGSVYVNQQSANNPNANNKWRHSSKSNDDANNKHLHVKSNNASTNCIIFNEDVSHRVDVASEYRVDYNGNNPLQRLILPLFLTLEAAIRAPQGARAYP